MSDCEYVSKTWHSLCTPWSERQHFLISKPDTLDSWHLTPHFTWVAAWPRSPFSGSCRVAGVTVDTAVLCYAELWEPQHISTTLSLRKSVSNQMDCTAVCVCRYVCANVCRLSSSKSSWWNNYDYSDDYDVNDYRAWVSVLLLHISLLIQTLISPYVDTAKLRGMRGGRWIEKIERLFEQTRRGGHSERAHLCDP